MNTEIQNIVEEFLSLLSARNEAIVNLFSEVIDWDIQGNEKKAIWIGKLKSKNEVANFFKLLWENIKPLSANIDDVLINNNKVGIFGNFSVIMNKSGIQINSNFSIYLVITAGKITKYRLLEDSYAVSESI